MLTKKTTRDERRQWAMNTAANLKRKPLSNPSVSLKPDVSTIGTQLRTAFEAATSQAITCGTCLNYLRSLNHTTTHNRDDIILRLRGDLGIPQSIRTRYPTLDAIREWIASIVDSVLNPPQPVVTIADPGATQFVWPYWHGGANGDEIRWSVRSVETFFTGKPTCTIVGDRPPWYTGHVIDCPRIESSGDQTTYRPALRDMLNKMRIIAASPQIASEFVWMMDDVYFIKPFSTDDLRQPRAVFWKERSDNGWQKVKTTTMRRLAEVGLPQLDYATHLPHEVERSKLTAILHSRDTNRTDMLWENLYGNTYHTDPQAVEPFLRRLQHKMTGLLTCLIL